MEKTYLEQKNTRTKKKIEKDFALLKKIILADSSFALAQYLPKRNVSRDTKLKTYHENKLEIIEFMFSKIEKYMLDENLSEYIDNSIIIAAEKEMDSLREKIYLAKTKKSNNFTYCFKTDKRSNKEICKDNLESLGTYSTYLDDCSYCQKYGY